MTHAPDTTDSNGIAAILFDLDGTLIDSETPGLDVLHEQAARLGVPITREQVHADFRGMRMSLIVESIGARLAQRPDNFDEDFTRTVACGHGRAVSAGAGAIARRRSPVDPPGRPGATVLRRHQWPARESRTHPWPDRPAAARCRPAVLCLRGGLLEARPAPVPACGDGAGCSCGRLRRGGRQPGRRGSWPGRRHAGVSRCALRVCCHGQLPRKSLRLPTCTRWIACSIPLEAAHS